MNVIGRSNVVPRESVIRMLVLNVPTVFAIPIKPAVVDDGKLAGSGAPFCTRIPGMGVAPGVYENVYGGLPPKPMSCVSLRPRRTVILCDTFVNNGGYVPVG